MNIKKINIAETFELENVTLKRTVIDYAEERVAVLLENIDHIRQFLRFADSSYNMDNEIKYVESTAKRWEEGRNFEFTIFENSTGKYIGSCSIMVKSKERLSFEFGYWLAKSATGKGYMTQIVAALTEYLQKEYNPRRIIIRCCDENLHSAGVALRNGFLFEGRGYCGDFESDYYTFVKVQEQEKMQKLASKQDQLKQAFDVNF